MKCKMHGCDANKGGSSCLLCVEIPQRNKTNQCASCNPGHYLNHEGECREWGCVTDQNTDCRSCVDISNRTSARSCEACHTGYYLSAGGKCEPFTCDMATDGGKCLDCVDQNFRTSGADCSECNDGFYLDGVVCKPWDCHITADNGCKASASLFVNTRAKACSVKRFIIALHSSLSFALLSRTSLFFSQSLLYIFSHSLPSLSTLSSLSSLPPSLPTLFPRPLSVFISLVLLYCPTPQACPDQALRSSHSTCSSCNAGYNLIAGGKCEPFTCDTATSGGKCRECVNQNFRTSGADCSKCNNGFYLDGAVCQPWDCVRAGETGCKASAMRTVVLLGDTSLYLALISISMFGRNCRP